MKYALTLTIICLLVLSLGFVIAEQGEGNSTNEDEITVPPMPGEGRSENNPTVGIGQTVRNRVHAGNYTSESGETIEVRALAQNKTRLKIKNKMVDTELEIESEENENNTIKLKTRLSNGRNVHIKIMPEVASETALNRLKIKVCNESNNCTIKLKEVGKDNSTKLAYEFQLQRHYKLLGMFKIKAETRARISAENGELIDTDKPWWAFLASEPSEIEETETEDSE